MEIVSIVILIVFLLFLVYKVGKLMFTSSKKDANTSKPVADNSKQKIIERKTLLYSLPASILMALDINAKLLLKYGFQYQGIQQIEVLLILIGLCVCLVGLPIYLALYSENKNKSWIICLAALCFLPFGAILYCISLVWAITISFNKIKKNILDKKNNIHIKPVSKIANRKNKVYIITGIILLLGIGAIGYLNFYNKSSVECKRTHLIVNSLNYTAKKLKQNDTDAAHISACGTWGVYTFSDDEIVKVYKDNELWKKAIYSKVLQCETILAGTNQKEKDEVSTILLKAMDFVDKHKYCLPKTADTEK